MIETDKILGVGGQVSIITMIIMISSSSSSSSRIVIIILGVGGQGTVYLCHKQSNPAVKFAVKTIPIWRLLARYVCCFVSTLK